MQLIWLKKQNLEQKEKTKKLKTKQIEENELKQAYDIYRQKQIDEYINQLPSEEYKIELEKISDNVFKNNPFVTSKKSKVFQHLLKSHFHENLIEQGKIIVLSFKNWQTQFKS